MALQWAGLGKRFTALSILSVHGNVHTARMDWPSDGMNGVLTACL